MKILKLLMLGLFFIASSQSRAQVSVNVNIGTPPAWGPAGYNNVRYYYLPDAAMYYDVNTTEYIYAHNGAWVRTTHVPAAYRNYDFYKGYKVVLTNYNGAAPYSYYKTHKVKYPKGYHPGVQRTIGAPPGHIKKAHEAHKGPGWQRAKKGHGHGHGHNKH